MEEKKNSVTEKVKQLTDAVSAANGSVLVIGVVDGGGGDESCVISALRGNSATLAEAIAILLSNDSAQSFRDLLSNSIAMSALYKIAGCHADKVEVKNSINR